MSRKFITEKEIAFNSSIIKEFIQNFVDQHVHYYTIDPEENNVTNVYGEQIRKRWKNPVRINALVSYDDTGAKSTVLGQDQEYTLEVYFHTQELIDRNVKPSEGDFVEFGQIFFEITSVSQPQLFFGQANNKILTKATCVASREGQFAAGSSSEEDVDNSNPVNPTPPRSLGGS